MFQLLLIASAGAAGTLARHGFNLALHHPSARLGYAFSTLLVNLLGCFLAGLLNGCFLHRASAGHPIPEAHRLALTVGFLGGFTTFSAFGFETALLLRDHHYARAALHILANNLLGIALALAGLVLARKLA